MKHYKVLVRRTRAEYGYFPVNAESKEDAESRVDSLISAGASASDSFDKQFVVSKTVSMDSTSELQSFKLENDIHKTSTTISEFWGESARSAWMNLKSSHGIFKTLEIDRIRKDLCGVVGCQCGIVTGII